MKITLSIIAIFALSSISACTRIKSYFPDKEKEYQYTTELPPLIYPADLKVNVLPVLPGSMAHAEPTIAAPNIATNALTKPTAVASEPSTTPTADKAYSDEEELAAKLVTVERINVDASENRLRLNVPFIRAWRILGKSLSRKALEVMVRDQEAGFFILKYDPDEHNVKDLSYMDSLKALIGNLRSNEKTYIIKLVKDQPQTDVIVLDKDKKPIADADSVKLLTLIQETIKADLATHK
ncbi:MAG: outer membrane protein assembly factor BamC [Methylococcales bacterium]|nr:outer membrane protein assembly factor BamC [Methylococcales bacterium]